MALSRTVRDALDKLPGRAHGVAGTDGSDVFILSTDAAGILKSSIIDSGGTFGAGVAQNTVADGASSSDWHKLAVLAVNYVWNGTTLDRVRNNTDITVLASAARTASVDSADLTNYNGKGVHVVIDVTALAATPSIVATIQGKDALSGKYYTILASAAITATGTTVLKVHPALTAAANTVANDLLPRTWRVSVVAGDADSITYSIGASLV